MNKSENLADHSDFGLTEPSHMQPMLIASCNGIPAACMNRAHHAHSALSCSALSKDLVDVDGCKFCETFVQEKWHNIPVRCMQLNDTALRSPPVFEPGPEGMNVYGILPEALQT